MQVRSILAAFVIGAIAALVAVLVIVPAATGLRASPPPESPQLPDGVTASTESGNSPYGSFEAGVLQSYWVPFLDLVRERYPDARLFDAFRRRSLALGGSLHRQRDDPDTLLAKLRVSAAETGWERITDLAASSSIYDFECFGQSGYVFCILGFKDTLRSGPSDTVVLDLDALRRPPKGEDDFAAVYIITDVADSGANTPGISPAAAPIAGG